jgi:rRNA maturation endonuclease Nob1
MKMARLVDADALLKCIPYEDVNSRFAVQNAPTIEERKKGKWISYLQEGLRYKCSECESRYEAPWHFCPNCGADMREEDV